MCACARASMCERVCVCVCGKMALRVGCAYSATLPSLVVYQKCGFGAYEEDSNTSAECVLACYLVSLKRAGVMVSQ